MKRVYIPLPDKAARQCLLAGVLEGQPCRLTAQQLQQLVQRTEGYSGSDISALCREAAMVPIRCAEELSDWPCVVSSSKLNVC